MSEAASPPQAVQGSASFRQGWPWLLKLGVLLLLALAVLWFLRKIYHTALIFFFAYLIAALLNPVVLWLTRRNVSRVAAIIAVYSILLLGACALILLAVPSLVNQIQALLNVLPAYLAKAQDLFVHFQARYESLKLPPNVREAIQTHGTQFLEKIGALAGRGVQQLGNVLLGLISWFFIFLAALAVSLFLLLNMGAMEAQFYRLLPERYRADARALLGELGEIFGGFLRGQLILCLLMWIFTLLSLYLLDLFRLHFEYTLIVSFLCAVLYAAPYVGIFVATVVACLLAYLQTGHYLLPLLLFLIISVLSRVVDNVFVPIVMGKEVGVSPLFIIFAIFAGGELAGFWGLILAIPVAAMLRAVCVFVWKRYVSPFNDQQPVAAS